MTLEIYRRHNKDYCTSSDSIRCKPLNANCPIYVRGIAPTGVYVRGSLKIWAKRIIRDEADARKFIEKWEREARTPESIHVPLTKWRDDFMADAASQNLDSETIRKYKYLFKQLIEFADAKNLHHVRQFDVVATASFRATWKISPRTAAATLGRLRSIMNFAVARDWLSKNPAKELKPPQVPVSDVQPFTKDEMKRILAAAKDDPRTYAFIVTMRASGLRISDVTVLDITALSDDNRLRLIQTKTRRAVTILLGDADAAILRSVAHLNPNKQYFFQTGNAELAAATDMWRERIKAVFKAAGIKGGKPHTFRHTFAAEFLAMGKSIFDLQRLLGHESVKTTEKFYSKFIKANQDRLDSETKATHHWRAGLETAAPGNVRPISGKRG